MKRLWPDRLFSPQRCEEMALLLLAVPLAVAVIVLGWRATLYVSITPNEGWNAYLAKAAAAGTPIYFPLSDFRVNNYPPLSFYVVAAVMRLVHDAVFAGRIVAWASFLAIGVSIHAILRSLGNDRIAAASAVMLFAGYIITQHANYVGMDDPQMFGHAVMMSGLVILLRGTPDVRNAVAAAVVMSLGLFIKHNIVALPLAVTAWLLMRNQRAGFAFMATGVICAIAGLAACLAIFGSDFLAGLSAPRLYGIAIGYRKIIPWLVPLQIPLALAVLSVVPPLRDRYALLFLFYAVTALVVGAAAAMGDGVYYNCMFEFVIALSLVVGHLFGRLAQRDLSKLRRLRPLAIAIAGFSLLVLVGAQNTADALKVLPWIKSMRAADAATRQTVAIIAARPGPALCETLTYCYWAHKAYEVDTFNYGQAVRIGAKDEGVLIQRIAAGNYATVQMNPGPFDAERAFLQARTIAALHTRYVSLHVAPAIGEIFVPR